MRSSSRSLTLLALAALLVCIGAGGAGAAKLPGAAFFRLSHVHVQATPGVLTFRVSVIHAPAGDQPTLEWSLAPAGGGAACENSSYGAGTASLNGLIVWDQQGPSFRWAFEHGRCSGKVAVLAENQYEHCTATVAVSPAGTNSAAPACALGGYAIGFSTLPVPAGVFKAYGTVRARLSTRPRTAAAAVRAIDAALRAQQAAFAEFPPVWFCSFTRVFAPIEALRVDLLRGTSTDVDAAAAERTLAKCAPATVRAAFARFASSPSAAALEAALARGFPTLFGFRFGDLINRVAAEVDALDAARAAAAADSLETARQQLATASTSAKSISTTIDHYQRRVVRVENAHG